ncbi:hydantoinase B/oxoprolinase family protein [Roseovarius pacificus]|uniref:hydantoinase B/oxoprolinase family protein n=1 Tax=Roseovarius pacificus TaxID=337701 RepID=UPI002A18B75F|nr:hydantoinase B/oxoprolinase family protein [Roseovarius pacificus]
MKTVFENDPITFQVIRGALYGICGEMKTVMTRGAFSPLLSLSADFSCALLDHDGNVVAQGQDIPVHLGAMPFSAKGILESFPAETWKPGDAVLSNDPYSGGSHLPDMTMLSGIFESGQLIGFSASRVHWPDIGGASAGSSSVTDEIIKEGLRIPPVKIIKGGQLDPDVKTILFANVRVQKDRVGDFEAQVACNNKGVMRVDELVARYGGDVVKSVFAETQSYSQRLTEAVIKEIPDGVYSAEDHLDGDGFIVDQGDGPLKLKVSVTKRGTGLFFDFTGTGAQARGPMNAPIAVTASACYYVILALGKGEIPPNSGAYRLVEVNAPKGSLVNAAYPAPVVSGNTEMSNRVVDLLMMALAEAIPDHVVGGSYGCGGVWAIGGDDSVRNKRFVHLETTGGGMGASRAGAGLDGHRVHMGNTMNLPIEAVEASFPVEVDEYELIEGSGGQGVHRGGHGVRRSIRALVDGIEFSLSFERKYHPAPGIAGGKAGRPARFYIRHPDGSQTELGSKTVAGRLMTDEVLVMETAGGGGWGSA